MPSTFLTTRQIRHSGTIHRKGALIELDPKDAAHLLAHDAITPIDASGVAALKPVDPREFTKDELIAYAEEKFGLTLVDGSSEELPDVLTMKKPQLLQEAKVRELKVNASNTVEELRTAVLDARELALKA